MNKINFERLNNTRDLGGIVTAYGVIKPGKLIRSGGLESAGPKDIDLLQDLVSLVVDFRTDQERSQGPDPEIEGIDNIHIPVIGDLTAGISRDEKSDEQALRMLVTDPEGSMNYMCRIYKSFITSERSLEGYRKFVETLLEGRNKAILWHCTAGKDRTGFATAIVLEMLGADRETIISNYLRSNELREPALRARLKMYAGDKDIDPKLETAFRNLFGARREYFDAAYSKADEVYGSFSNYLLDGLKLTHADIERMRNLYLYDPEK